MKQSVTTHPRTIRLSESALTVEFGESIDLQTNEMVLAFAAAVEHATIRGLVEVVPTYRSATVYFNHLLTDAVTLTKRLQELMSEANTPPPRPPTIHTIPVWYGGAAGPDLADIAGRAGLTPAQAAALHSSVTYRVYMLGFSPGFPYLGTVPDRIVAPRLPTPREQVAAGSVGIAGAQTGIYPQASPGGWRIIGRTPISPFSLTRPKPFLLAPGDQVRFIPINEDEFQNLFVDHR